MIQINWRKAQTHKKEAWTKKERFVHSCTFITYSTFLEKIADDLRTQLRAAKQIRDREANKNKSEIEYYKDQVETLKRLAAEKEALLIQKNLKNSLHSSKRSKRRSSSEFGEYQVVISDFCSTWIKFYSDQSLTWPRYFYVKIKDQNPFGISPGV